MSDTCFFHFLKSCSETYWDCGCLRYKDRVVSCRLSSLSILRRKSFPYKWKYLLFSSIFFSCCQHGCLLQDCTFVTNKEAVCLPSNLSTH